MKQWKRYKSYILPYKSAFILGPLMMVTEVLGEILLPKFMSMIINHGVAQKDGGRRVSPMLRKIAAPKLNAMIKGIPRK